jgi:hypothetical protein
MSNQYFIIREAKILKQKRANPSVLPTQVLLGDVVLPELIISDHKGIQILSILPEVTRKGGTSLNGRFGTFITDVLTELQIQKGYEKKQDVLINIPGMSKKGEVVKGFGHADVVRPQDIDALRTILKYKLKSL